MRGLAAVVFGLALVCDRARADEFDDLLAGLQHAGGNERARAALGLGRLRDKRALDPLAALLRDKQAHVRAAAILALGRIGEVSGPVLTGLVDLRSDPDEDVRATAVRIEERLRMRAERRHRGGSIVRRTVRALPTLRRQDFRDTAVGTYPRGWTPYVSGKGAQVVERAGPDGRPGRSFRLEGQPHWSRADVIPLPQVPEQMTWEFSFLPDPAPGRRARVGFPESRGNLLLFFDFFRFESRQGVVGAIRFISKRGERPVPLGCYAVGEWIRLSADLDFRMRRATLWVDGDRAGMVRITPRRFRSRKGVDVVLKRWGAAHSNWRGGPAGAIHIDDVWLRGILPPDGDEFKELVKRLKHEKSDERQKAVRELARMREARAIEPLITALQDENWAVRWHAVNGLASRKDPRVVAPLMAVLQDDPRARVRIEAAQGLGRVGDRQAVPVLIERLETDPDPGVKGAAADSLGGLRDDRALPGLRDAVKDPASNVRAAAAVALARLGRVEPVLAAMADADEHVRLRAAAQLGGTKDPRAVPLLVAALRDPAMSVRRSAGAALLRQRWKPATPAEKAMHLVALQKWDEAVALGNAAVDALLVALRDQKTRKNALPALARLEWEENATDAQRAAWLVANRRWDDAVALGPVAYDALVHELRGRWVPPEAVLALGRLGDKRAVPHVAAVLRCQYKRARYAAAQALALLGWKPASKAEEAWRLVALQRWADAAKLGPPAVEPFLNALRDADITNKAEVGGYLARIAPASLESLTAALREHAYRDEAIQSLARLGDTRAVPALLALGKEKGWNRVPNAALVLGELGDARALEPLVGMLQDKQTDNRCAAAAEALGLLGDPRATEPLIAALKDPRASREAAQALGRLGDRRAVPPLIELLNKGGGTVLDVPVARALGRIGDPRALDPLVAVATGKRRTPACCAAIEALGDLGDARAAGTLAGLLTHVDTGKKRSAALALAKLGDHRAFGVLTAAVRSGMPVDGRSAGHPDDLIFAAKGLADLGDARARPALVTALRGIERRIAWGRTVGAHGTHARLETVAQAFLTAALARLGEKGAIDRVIRCLEHPMPEARAHAAATLGTLGPAARRALPALETASHDAAREVRLAARRALRDIRGTR